MNLYFDGTWTFDGTETFQEPVAAPDEQASANFAGTLLADPLPESVVTFGTDVVTFDNNVVTFQGNEVFLTGFASATATTPLRAGPVPLDAAASPTTNAPLIAPIVLAALASPTSHDSLLVGSVALDPSTSPTAAGTLFDVGAPAVLDPAASGTTTGPLRVDVQVIPLVSVTTHGASLQPGSIYLEGHTSATAQQALTLGVPFDFDTLLAELAAAAETAHAQKRAGTVTRSITRAYQATLRMQQEDRPLGDWTRLAAALVVSMATTDTDRADTTTRMREHRARRAYAWAALALEEEAA